MNTPINPVLNADCLDVMPRLANQSVQFILTDPPYITAFKDRDGRTLRNDGDTKWLKPAYAQMYRVLAKDSFCVSSYGWPQADKFMEARSAGFRIVGRFIFAKPYTSSTRFVQYRHESAHLLVKGNPKPPQRPIPDGIDWQYTGNPYHLTQKPVSALLPLVEAFSKPTDTVLDPFAGSGSSPAAAALRGRNYLGIEIDAKYHAIAKRRLAKYGISHCTENAA